MKDYSKYTTWYTDILTIEGKNLFEKLSHTRILEDFYLAGGTALSLYLGHRKSIDFDFFSAKEFKSNKVSDFTIFGKPKISVLNDNAIEFKLKSVKIMLLAYFYPTSQNFNEYNYIKIASPIDIALMKITAMEGRVSWKDLIDLYFIDKKVIELENLAKLYLKIYPQDSLNTYSQLKIILNEEELSYSPKPDMLENVDFERAKDIVYSKLLKAFAGHIQNTQ